MREHTGMDRRAFIRYRRQPLHAQNCIGRTRHHVENVLRTLDKIIVERHAADGETYFDIDRHWTREEWSAVVNDLCNALDTLLVDR